MPTQIQSSDISQSAFRIITETIPSSGGQYRAFSLTYNPIGINAVYGHISIDAKYAGMSPLDFNLGNSNELLIVDTNATAGSYRKINISGNTIVTFAGVNEYGLKPYPLPTYGNPSIALGATLGANYGAAYNNEDSCYYVGNYMAGSYSNGAIMKISGNMIYLYGGNSSLNYYDDFVDGTPVSGIGFNDTSGGGRFICASGQIYYGNVSPARIFRVDSSGLAWHFAGNGSAGYNGDDIAATGAQIYGAQGFCINSSGMFYFCDTANQRIRTVDTSGIIHTIAGDGNPGYTGDNGPAISARVSNPQGLGIDGLGNVYFSDTQNYVIRKINISGIITTVAGNGLSPTSYGVEGPALTTAIYPTLLHIDSNDNIYFKESDSLIRKLDINTSTITTAYGLGGSVYTEGEYILNGMYMSDTSDIDLFLNKNSATLGGGTFNKILYANSGTSVNAQIFATQAYPNPSFNYASIDSFKVIYTTSDPL